MRILFVTSTRIGDAVLSTGLLDHLLRTYPGARITVACGPAAEGLFTRMPGRERTIVVAKRRWSMHWLDLWGQVATSFWDLVVDLRGSALGWLVPARRRVVMRGGRRPGHRLGHIAEVLRLDPPPPPVAWFAPEDEARVSALLGDDRPLLLLGPTANWDGKVWSPGRFVALAQALTAPGGVSAGARPVLLGGPGEGERALAAPVVQALPQALDLVGALSLPEAAALLSRGLLFVGNDSGLMHLSAATGAPTLGLFGPTPAGEYAPVGRAARAVVSPDGTMDGLSVEHVLDAARALLPAQVAA
ncbi:glycosyltransferase family 9 protein [Roseomonas xinghualingensis]|uniref:glycosyltransferase family 9 protein n=1 Tax=Roseomonas xinghualingensis TaxID=2986475 RepID=UPI0021F1805F|nr:glycosyltransferase family 9 protein [Roseomonas sp. SXEYE001]MCV4206540.1 glycosyltransferase family 9 protein [Roseomonas sp. SXEYE001]